MQLKIPFLSKGSAELQKIIANTGWLFADRLLRMGLGLFVFTWVARYLGVEQFGQYSFATAFVGLFASLASMGLPSLVVRTLTHEPDRQNQVLGTTFILQILGGIVAFFLSILSIYLFRQQEPLTVTFVAILASASIFQAFDTIDIFYQSQVHSKYTVVVKNSAFVCFALVKIILINAGAPLIAFVLCTVGEVILGAVGLLVSYQVLGYSIWRWRWNFGLAKNLLKESWPLILSGLTIMIYMKIDQVMLGAMVNDKAVGLYSTATRISEVWYFIPTAVVSSVAPSIYLLKREGNEKGYYQRITKLLRTLNMVAVAIALPMTFASGLLVNVLFGPSFNQSGTILAIHIWASVFVFMGVATSPWFIAEGFTDLSFRRTFLGAIVNVVLNFLLIPVYGGVGAAIATVISQAIASLFSNILNPKTKRIFFVQIKAFSFYG